ncbi:MAG TPA: hypothetical protein VIM94_08895 [Salegentibacter sp.]|uniref:hypothetical protein n=1 Tax=Salegentibacter sp. TaxID=1903072 RepID=UPI002F92AC66
MKKKEILLLVFILLLLYPVYMAYEVLELFSSAQNPGEIRADITGYQLSIWLSWVGMMVVSVYYKWIQTDNFFFKLTYFFLVLAFGAFGYFTQLALNLFRNPSRFSDSYTLGVITALQHLAVAAILTIFLQIAVSLFQTKWHRL